MSSELGTLRLSRWSFRHCNSIMIRWSLNEVVEFVDFLNVLQEFWLCEIRSLHLQKPKFFPKNLLSPTSIPQYLFIREIWGILGIRVLGLKEWVQIQILEEFLKNFDIHSLKNTINDIYTQKSIERDRENRH